MPEELGPRVFRRGRYYACDLRPWNRGRPTMRNPRAPGWPEQGERTTLWEVADRWKWAYRDLVTGEHRRRVLGLQKGPAPIAKLAPRYLDHRRETVEQGTWSTDRTVVGYLLSDFPGMTPADVTPEAMQDWLDGMLRKGYQASTLATYLGAMGVFFRWAGEHDPTRNLTLPRRATQDVRWWTDAEVKSIREAADKLDDQRSGNFASCRLAIEVGLSMGLRQGEIFGLRWQDISEPQKLVRVDRQTIKDRNGTKPLKGKRSRTALILPDWWDHHRPAMGWVLPGKRGAPPGYRTQRNMIERVLDTAGLNERGVGWHSLRHTYAIRFLLAKGWVQELQWSLGHASIRITEERYGHMQDHQAAEMARRRIYGA